MADAWTCWAMELDEERENMTEQLGKGKEAWKSLKRQMTQVKKQYSEAKGQLGHLKKGMFELEDKNKKKAMKIDVHAIFLSLEAKEAVEVIEASDVIMSVEVIEATEVFKTTQILKIINLMARITLF